MNAINLNSDAYAKAAKRIRADQIRISDEPILTGGDPSQGGPITVTPVLEGDTVTRIEVRCSCGQHMTVVCLYPGEQEDTNASEE